MLTVNKQYKNRPTWLVHVKNNSFFIVRPLQFNLLPHELRRQEMSHFGIRKVEKLGFFIFNFFFRVCRLGPVARSF